MRLRQSISTRTSTLPWRHGLRLCALALPVAWLLQQAVLGPSGFLALRRKHQEVRQAQAQVQTLEARNRQLNQSIQALSSDPNAIEGIAREQLHLTKPGEVVYTYPVAGSPAGTAAADLH